MAQQTVVARRMFQYDTLRLDRGQVFQLRDKPNDRRLLDLGYVRPLEKGEGPEIRECGECGSKFIGDRERTGHGKLRHHGRDLTPDEHDALIEREMNRQEREAPLATEVAPATL